MRGELAVWGLLCWAPLVLCHPSFVERDSIVFPNQSDTEFSTTGKLKECLQDGENKIEFDGECRMLLTTQDVCPEGKWLVLDLRSASLPRPVIRGVCAPRRCLSGLHYWAATKSCIRSNEFASVCPPGNKVDTDFFGDGYCKCNSSSSIRDRDGACYRAYTKGPCKNDKVWVLVSNNPECRSDRCSSMRARLPDKVIVQWADGKCYAEQEQGPCPQGMFVQVNSSGQPECGEELTTLNLGSGSCSGSNHAGQCTHVITNAPNSFLNQVATQASKRTKKG